MTLSITLPSGDVGIIKAERYPMMTRDGFRVDVWAGSQREASLAAEHYGRAIDATLYPSDDPNDADWTISAGLVWVFGRPDVREVRDRIGFNVYIES